MSPLGAAGHLLEMHAAARQALDYCRNIDRAGFMVDRKTHQAVLLNLIIVGESSARILKDDLFFVERFPHIPWRNMKGMRNRIVHAYSTLNLPTIWTTLETSIPVLIAALPAMIEAARHRPSDL